MYAIKHFVLVIFLIFIIALCVLIPNNGFLFVCCLFHFVQIQFPPVSLCPDCRVANAGDDGQMPKWDNDAVLAFLFRFYGPRGIRWSDSDKVRD